MNRDELKSKSELKLTRNPREKLETLERNPAVRALRFETKRAGARENRVFKEESLAAFT